MTRIRQFTSKSPFPMCSLCNEPVELETAKTDEAGRVVHEECYVLRMQMEGATARPTENLPGRK
jgi:hypothetical protein